MTEGQQQLGTRSAALLTVPTAIAGLALGAMILIGVEGTARSVLAVLLVLGGGVGLGPLLLLTPVEPSALKLWLFSSLLGLPLVGGAFALTSGVLGADAEVARQVAEALREKVATSSIGATVTPAQLGLGHAHEAFGDDGRLKDERARGMLQKVVTQTLELAAR